MYEIPRIAEQTSSYLHFAANARHIDELYHCPATSGGKKNIEKANFCYVVHFQANDDRCSDAVTALN